MTKYGVYLTKIVLMTNNLTMLAVKHKMGCMLLIVINHLNPLYILHFGLLESQLDRHQYINNLDVFFKNSLESYQKNDIETFQLLRPFQEIARKRGKSLLHNNFSNTLLKRFPVTYVFELVEELNKFS